VTSTAIQVAVTGLGAIAANGHSVDEIWSNSLAGISGIRRLPEADAEGLGVDVAGAIGDFDFGDYVSRRDELTYDPSQLFATAAARMALEDAGGPAVHGADRIGVVIGSAGGAVRAHYAAAWAVDGDGPKAVSAYYPAAGAASLTASLPAMSLGLKGPVYAVSGACATAAYDLISASHLLAAGDADLVLAGAVELGAVSPALAGFANMRSLAHHAEPARASRPLDLHRNGLVFAEGAAVLALERLELARARGARIYALLTGYGMTSDAGNVLAADADGISRACRRALERAGREPDDVDHVSLHAAGTQQGDLAEAQAVHDVFGERAATIPVTAPKSLFGHAMGAAAGLETIMLMKTFETGVIPPTINLDTPDPAIRLNASKRAVEASVGVALKTSSGLGGLNAALVFEALLP
jgi:3-oxoacyl-[acyl-carrier-protein] synthase II